MDVRGEGPADLPPDTGQNMHEKGGAMSDSRTIRRFAAKRGAAIAAMSLMLAPGLIAGPAFAQTPRMVESVPQASLPPANLRVADGKIALTLEEAVEIALARNLGLALERYDRQNFRLGIDAAMGIYDLNLSAGAQYSDRTSRNRSNLEGETSVSSTSTSSNAGLTQLTPFGGTASWTADFFKLETNSTQAQFNPAYTVNSDIGFTLPLLRGFGKEVTNQQILVARLQDRGSRAGFEQSISETIQRVENAYWDLVEARNQLQVAQEGLALAQELHRRNGIQVDVGTLAPLELVQSEANVATREVDIIDARTRVGNAEDALRQLLNLDQGPEWAAEITPESDPKTDAVAVELDDSIRAALAKRPEIAAQRLLIETEELNNRVARNALKPELNLTVGYGLEGSGGDEFDLVAGPNPGDPLTRVLVARGGVSDALDQVKDRDFEGWSVGLAFRYPLQNRTAEAQSAQAQIAVDRSRTVLSQLEQSVITEVRSAVRQLKAAEQQIGSAAVSRRLQERNLEAEQKRYENGMSTSFQITRIQDDLTQAKSREVSAIAGYRRALTEYYRALGTLLETTGVELAEPSREPAANAGTQQ